MNDLRVVIERMNGAVRSPQVLELLSVYYNLDNLPWEMSKQLSARQKLDKDKSEVYWNAQECEHEYWIEGLGNVNDRLKYRVLELIGLAYIFNSASKDVKFKLTDAFDYYVKAEPNIEMFILLLTAAVREYYSSINKGEAE
ncbi:hypothetical protein HNP21_006282 [Bacillus aryabhattai]|uniref:Uncharacterized protein n=1 Tax=Priestia aryabhattai TaxID=412384 RepID=A0A7W3NHG9_PRIAR|nr:hypothetical protein [Priestia aryabhattai]MBA9043104.1 hypothetical protein [Priestia aryabhattai]